MPNLRLRLVLLFAALPLVEAQAQAQTQPWTNKSLPPDQRAQLLASAMSQDQMLSLVHCYSGAYVYNIPGIGALGIPTLNMMDGAAGVAGSSFNGHPMSGVTVFPAPITLAATWDTALAKSYGDALGAEFSGKGVNVALGPTINMLRIPEGGRDYEAFGEDPVLTSTMVAAEIPAEGAHGVILTAKHLLNHEQETGQTANYVVDDRTEREVYLAPFAASVGAGATAVMCASNQVNGLFACQNSPLETAYIKTELGFKGFIMGDYDALQSTVDSANAGTDMETPGDIYFGSALVSAVSAGMVTTARLTDMATRILTAMFTAGLFDSAPSGSYDADVQSTAHTQLTRQIGAQGTALLSNAMGVLPLDPAKVKSIAVIGTSASTNLFYQGLGSAQVTATQGAVISPLQGITTRAGSTITVGYAAGDSAPFSDATSLAMKSDVAVVVVGTTSSELGDRSSIAVPDPGDALIAAVAQANPKTIVVVYVPGPVLMPWASQVAAILYPGLPGQEEGDSLADVLFGDVNPSGKLPYTLANARSDYAASTPAQYPGDNGIEMYSEGLLTGYRWFDAQGTAPLFPFGHGLSYTTFGYANLAVCPGSITSTDTVNVSLDLTNTGSVTGAEVVQLYLGMPQEASEPLWQLKAFQKVSLAAGAKQHVTFSLAPTETSFYSEGLQAAAAYPGTYKVAVGSSSRDVRLNGSFVLTGGPLSGTVHQAETAMLSGGATAATTGAGSTGSGYVTFGATGASVTFDLSVPQSGKCAITARYSAAMSASASQPAHTLSIYANGTKQGQVTFPPLANLSSWDFETQTLTLNSGSNTVAYTQDTGDTGTVSLDAILDCVPAPVSALQAGDGGTCVGDDGGGGNGGSSGGSSTTSSGGSSEANTGTGGSGGGSSGAGTGGNGSGGGSGTGGSGSGGSNGGGCAVGSSFAAGPSLFWLLLLPLARRSISRRKPRLSTKAA